MLQKITGDKITQQFFKYLKNAGISESSIKHYKSDFSKFSDWIIYKAKTGGMYIQSLNEAIPLIDKNTGNEYKSYLKSTSNSLKTINRRLATIRQLSRFLIESQVLDFDIMESVGNESTSLRKRSSSQSILISFPSWST